MGQFDVFHIAQGDLSPLFRVQFLDAANQPQSLVGAQSVTFSYRLPDGSLKVAAQGCTVEDAANGIVRYDWQVGDTDTSGFFPCTFRAVYGDGKPETFPNEKHARLHVFPAL